MMVDPISLNSVNYSVRPSDQITSRGNFMDSLRTAFKDATDNLDKYQLPGSDEYVYVPNGSPDATLSSLNMV